MLQLSLKPINHYERNENKSFFISIICVILSERTVVVGLQGEHGYFIRGFIIPTLPLRGNCAKKINGI